MGAGEKMSQAVGMTGPGDLSALWLASTYPALRLGDRVTTVGGKANNALLVLLKENKRNTVYSLRPMC